MKDSHIHDALGRGGFRAANSGHVAPDYALEVDDVELLGILLDDWEPADVTSERPADAEADRRATDAHVYDYQFHDVFLLSASLLNFM